MLHGVYACTRMYCIYGRATHGKFTDFRVRFGGHQAGAGKRHSLHAMAVRDDERCASGRLLLRRPKYPGTRVRRPVRLCTRDMLMI